MAAQRKQNPMPNTKVQDDLLQFVGLLFESELISSEQKSVLQEFVVESLPFYEDNLS